VPIEGTSWLWEGFPTSGQLFERDGTPKKNGTMAGSKQEQSAGQVIPKASLSKLLLT